MYTPKLSPALICISCPRNPPIVQGRDLACPPPSGKCWDLITASQIGARGIACQSVASAPWQELHCWNPKVIEMLIASRTVSAALPGWKKSPRAFTWGQMRILLIPGQRRPTPLISADSGLFFPWKSESSESVLSSLVQPNREKPTLQDGKLAVKYTVNVSKGAVTDIRITLLCLCSGRCRTPADH